MTMVYPSESCHRTVGENELITLAINEWKNSEKCIEELCEEFNIESSLLYQRISELKLPESSHFSHFIPKAVEDTLVEWAGYIVDSGFCLTLHDLRVTTKYLLSALPKGVKSPFDYGLPTVSWARAFIQQHYKLENHFRMFNTNSSNKTYVSNYSSALPKFLQENGYMDIVNDDSRVFSANTCVVKFSPAGNEVNTQVFEHYTSLDINENTDHMSILANVSAEGKMVTAMVVFKNIALPGKGSNKLGLIFRHGVEGLMNSFLFLSYLEVLDSWLRARSVPRPVLLFLNSLSSFVDIQVMNFSRKCKIVLYGLPASELGSIHPVSVGVFPVLKKLLPFEVKKRNVNLRESRSWVEIVLREVFSVADDPVTIRRAFRDTGIFPFVFNTEKSDTPMFVRKRTSCNGGKADMIAKLTDPKFVEEFYRSYNAEKMTRNLNYEELFKIWLTTAVKCRKDNNIIDVERFNFTGDKHLHEIFEAHKCKKVNKVEVEGKEKNGGKEEIELLSQVDGELVKLKHVEIPIDNNSSENATISLCKDSFKTNQYPHTNECFTSEINKSLSTSHIYSEFDSKEQSKEKYIKQNPLKRHSAEHFPSNKKKYNDKILKEQTSKVMNKRSKRKKTMYEMKQIETNIKQSPFGKQSKLKRRTDPKSLKNKIIQNDSEIDVSNKAKLSLRVLDVKNKRLKAKLFEHYAQQKYSSLSRKVSNRIKKQYLMSYSRNFAEIAPNKSLCNKVSSTVFGTSVSFTAPSLEFASSLLSRAIPNISVITNGSKSSASNTCTITSEINSIVVPSAPLTIVCAPESQCNFTFVLPSGLIHQDALDSGVLNGFNEKTSAAEWNSFMDFIASAKTKVCTNCIPKTHSNKAVERSVENLTKALNVEQKTDERNAFINPCNIIAESVASSVPTTTGVMNPNGSNGMQSNMDPISIDSDSPGTNSSPVMSYNYQRKLLIKNGEEINLLGAKEKHDPSFTNMSVPNNPPSKVNSPLSRVTYVEQEKVLDCNESSEQYPSVQTALAATSKIHSSLSEVPPAKRDKLSALSNINGPNWSIKSLPLESPLKISSPSTEVSLGKHDKMLVSYPTLTDVPSLQAVPQIESRIVRKFGLRKRKRIPYYLTQGPDDKLPITPEELLDVSQPKTLAIPLSNKPLGISSKKEENQFDSTKQPKSIKLACGTSSPLTRSLLSRVGDSKQAKLLEANIKSGPNCTTTVSGTSSPIITAKLTIGDAKGMQDYKYVTINEPTIGVSSNKVVGSPSTLYSTAPQRQPNFLVAQPNSSPSTVSQVQSKLLVAQPNAAHSSSISQEQSKLLVGQSNTLCSTVAQMAQDKSSTAHVAGQSYSKIILIPELGTGCEQKVKYLVPIGKERTPGINQQMPVSASKNIANTVNPALNAVKTNDKLVLSSNATNRLENVNYKVVTDHRKSVVFSNPSVKRTVMSTTPRLVTNCEQDSAVNKSKYVPFFGARDKQNMLQNNLSVVQQKEIERSSVRSEVLSSMDVHYQPQQAQTIDHTKENVRYLQRIPEEILFALKTSNRQLLSKLMEGEEEGDKKSETNSTPTFSAVNNISSLANSQETIFGNDSKQYLSAAGCSEDHPDSCNESNSNVDQRAQQIANKVQHIAENLLSSEDTFILPDTEQSSYKSELNISSTVNNSINHPSFFSQQEIFGSYGENNNTSKDEAFILPDQICLQEDKLENIEIKKEIKIETEIDIQENIKIEEGNLVDKKFEMKIEREIKIENEIKMENEIKVEN